MLSRMLSRGVERDLIDCHRVGREEGLLVSYLQYAGDTILLTSNRLDSFQNILSLLIVFESISGLKINWSKSSVSGIHIGDHTL